LNYSDSSVLLLWTRLIFRNAEVSTISSFSFLIHHPKEDLSLLLQYILKSLNDRQYNDKINCHDITVIYYKYATITIQHRISHKRDQIKRFGPTNKSSVSGGRGTNLSQWVFLRAKYMLWVNEFASRLNRVNLLTSAILIFSYVTRFLINSNLLVYNCKKHKEQTKNLRHYTTFQQNRNFTNNLYNWKPH